MYKRQIASRLAQLAKQYPVVTVTGPRQSGKTTLVCSVFPEKPYANLENLDERQLATSDPRSFLSKFPHGAILDEIQRVPSLLSYIQTTVDQADQEGMFILTGSQQLELHQSISQSLAGRTALLTLLPMSLQELGDAGINLSLEEAIVTGGYPRIYKKQLEPTTAYDGYLQTYLERDLRQLINVKDLDAFQRFLQLCAGRVGHLLVRDNLASDVGVSPNTIKHWISILEASYLIVQLRPYAGNFGKRLIKHPKLYFTDVGLACHLLGIDTAEQVAPYPLYGNLMENLVLLELMKHRLNAGRQPRLFFYRDRRGMEIDFLYQSGHQLIPIEVKAGRTFNNHYLDGLKTFQTLAGDRAPHGYLIYAGSQEQKIESLSLLNYRNAAEALN